MSLAERLFPTSMEDSSQEKTETATGNESSVGEEVSEEQRNELIHEQQNNVRSPSPGLDYGHLLRQTSTDNKTSKNRKRSILVITPHKNRELHPSHGHNSHTTSNPPKLTIFDEIVDEYEQSNDILRFRELLSRPRDIQDYIDLLPSIFSFLSLSILPDKRYLSENRIDIVRYCLTRLIDYYNVSLSIQFNETNPIIINFHDILDIVSYLIDWLIIYREDDESLLDYCQLENLEELYHLSQKTHSLLAYLLTAFKYLNDYNALGLFKTQKLFRIYLLWLSLSPLDPMEKYMKFPCDCCIDIILVFPEIIFENLFSILTIFDSLVELYNPIVEHQAEIHHQHHQHHHQHHPHHHHHHNDSTAVDDERIHVGEGGGSTVSTPHTGGRFPSGPPTGTSMKSNYSTTSSGIASVDSAGNSIKAHNNSGHNSNSNNSNHDKQQNMKVYECLCDLLSAVYDDSANDINTRIDSFLKLAELNINITNNLLGKIYLRDSLLINILPRGKAFLKKYEFNENEMKWEERALPLIVETEGGEGNRRHNRRPSNSLVIDTSNGLNQPTMLKNDSTGGGEGSGHGGDGSDRERALDETEQAMIASHKKRSNSVNHTTITPSSALNRLFSENHSFKKVDEISPFSPSPDNTGEGNLTGKNEQTSPSSIQSGDDLNGINSGEKKTPKERRRSMPTILPSRKDVLPPALLPKTPVGHHQSSGSSLSTTPKSRPTSDRLKPTNLNNEINPILLSSYLSKVGSFFPSVKKRWFQLTDDKMIRYWTNEKCTTLKGILRIINIRKVTKLERDNWFEWICDDSIHGGNFRLQCDNPEIYMKWNEMLFEHGVRDFDTPPANAIAAGFGVITISGGNATKDEKKQKSHSILVADNPMKK
jgi:hypothetical protein